MKTFASIVAATGLMLAAGFISAQTLPPGPPPEGGTELGNFGSLPFRAQQTLVLRPDERASLRRLEDKHVKEARELEDKFESELRAMRIRQAEEREALLKTFAR